MLGEVAPLRLGPLSLRVKSFFFMNVHVKLNNKMRLRCLEGVFVESDLNEMISQVVVCV